VVNPVTWRGSNGGGGSGDWGSPIDWSGFATPQPGEAVTISGTGATVTLATGEAGAAQSVLLLGDTLALSGSLAIGASGVLEVGSGGALRLTGTLQGGRLQVDAGGTLLGQGGTLDGVVLGAGASVLGGIAITPATVTANAGGSIGVAGTLVLAGGSDDGIGFVLASPTAELNAAPGGVVTLGPRATVTLSDDTLSAADTVGFGGGTFVNDGTILSTFANGTSGVLAITAAGFTNDATMSFGDLTMLQVASQVPIAVSTNHVGLSTTTYGDLSYIAAYAPTLDIATMQFVNDGTLALVGGTLDVVSGSFENLGAVLLNDAVSQSVQLSGRTAEVVSATLTTRVRFGADVTGFTNIGTIVADTVEFDGSVALGSLGAMSGALDFEGGIDLGGGTLDASSFGTVTVAGTVSNGALAAGSGVLVLHDATLRGVAIAAGGSVEAVGPITLLDPPPGVSAVTLDATTTELGFTGVTANAGTLTVIAGSTAATDTIAMSAGGTLTLGAAFTLDAVAGTTDIAAGATVVLHGTLGADGAALDVGAALDGDGTIALADGAAVILAALAPTAGLTVAFGAGPALLVLPGNGAGVTFIGLHEGDVIDFTSVSSRPSTAFVQPGAVLDSSTGGTSLDVTGASGETAAVAVQGASNGLTFSTPSDDGGGGTLVVAACFRAGTRIATPGAEVAVERLRIGDAVLTAAGEVRRIKWLGRRHYGAREVAANPQLRPVRIAPGALADGVPARVLEVSAEHGLWVAGALVPAGALVNGRSITRAGDCGDVDYVHIELAEHALILVEGAAAESFVAAIPRSVFDNADEYAALYPHEAARAPVTALPRASEGEAVARAWALCAERSGMRVAASHGELRGHAKRIVDGVLEGLACDGAWPTTFEVLADGVPVARVTANGYRPDLDFHGLPPCAFRVPVPAGRSLALRRVGDGAGLPFSSEALAA
jgi:hypothetical protein